MLHNSPLRMPWHLDISMYFSLRCSRICWVALLGAFRAEWWSISSAPHTPSGAQVRGPWLLKTCSFCSYMVQKHKRESPNSQAYFKSWPCDVCQDSIEQNRVTAKGSTVHPPQCCGEDVGTWHHGRDMERLGSWLHLSQSAFVVTHAKHIHLTPRPPKLHPI